MVGRQADLRRGGFLPPVVEDQRSCTDSQGSQPTVNPTTGQLWVGFINGDTEDEDQYLVVTSKDGGKTFSQPMPRGHAL